MTDVPTPPPGRVTIERYGDARIVSLHGDHDVASEPLVRDLLAEARGAGGLVFVDLTAATFIESTIAVSLFEAYLADRPPRLRFAIPAGTPPRVIFDRIAGATGLPIYESLEDALADRAVG
jgi:anti-sigma B factor antagonist